MITEQQYQQILEPYKSAHIMFPESLENFERFIRQNLDPDASDFENTLFIHKWLLAINEIMYPRETKAIRNKNAVLFQEEFIRITNKINKLLYPHNTVTIITDFVTGE